MICPIFFPQIAINWASSSVREESSALRWSFTYQVILRPREALTLSLFTTIMQSMYVSTGELRDMCTWLTQPRPCILRREGKVQEEERGNEFNVIGANGFVPIPTGKLGPQSFQSAPHGVSISGHQEWVWWLNLQHNFLWFFFSSKMAHKLRPRIPSVLVLEENLVVLDSLRDNLGEKLYRHFEALPRIHFDMCLMCLVLSHMRGSISIL